MADRPELLIVGAGPAGLAAAAAAAEVGARVTVVDENPRAGGQIWRAPRGAPLHPETERLLAAARHAGVRHLAGRTVCDVARASADRWQLAMLTGDGTVETATADRVVLATGATELFLPFPGWTLPGVVGVGGLQALAKGGLDVRGRRVLIAGSGPLLLAVAASLLARGAHLAAIAEQAPRARVLGFGSALLRHPAKLRQGLGYLWALRRVPQWFGAWPTAVEAGADGLVATIRRGDREQRVAGLDHVAVGFGLVPATQLAELFGCRVDDARVAVDAVGRTSVAGVFCAGEPTGIGGVDVALAEGRIAGYAAAGAADRAHRVARAHAAEFRFAARLARAYALDPRLRDLPRAATLVCRCEDVPLSRVAACRDARQAKLETRCGMGPCQGRVCGPALRFLFGWERDRVRPPLVPVPMRALTALPSSTPIPEPHP